LLGEGSWTVKVMKTNGGARGLARGCSWSLGDAGRKDTAGGTNVGALLVQLLVAVALCRARRSKSTRRLGLELYRAEGEQRRRERKGNGGN
jgi:hypothetical protein